MQGLGLWILGFRVDSLGFRVHTGLSIQVTRSRVKSYRITPLGYRVQGSGFKDTVGFRV